MAKNIGDIVALLQAHVERAVESRDALLRLLVDERTRQLQNTIDEREKQSNIQSDEREKQSILRSENASTGFQEAMRSLQLAIDKAEGSNNERFKSVNELRGALLDAQTNFPQRNEILALVDALEGKIATTDKQYSTLQLQVATLVTQAQHTDLQQQITVLRDAQNQGTGKEKQVAVSTQSNQWITGLLIFAGIAFAGLLISITNMLIASGAIH